MLLTFSQEHIKNEVSAKLDSKQCFIHQKPAVVQEIIQSESSNNQATRLAGMGGIEGEVEVYVWLGKEESGKEGQC